MPASLTNTSGLSHAEQALNMAYRAMTRPERAEYLLGLANRARALNEEKRRKAGGAFR